MPDSDVSGDVVKDPIPPPARAPGLRSGRLAGALNDCISVMFSVITVSSMLKLTVLSEIRFNPEDEGEEDICLANKLS